MHSRFSPLTWSFPWGIWWGTRVRVSVFFPLLFVVLCLQLTTWQHGLLVGLLVVLSTVLHEAAHVWSARSTGGWADEILIWPLGGLIFVQPSPRCRDRVMTAAAGPLVNAVICLVTGVTVWRAGLLWESMNVFNGLPTVELFAGPTELLQGTVILLFFVNWLLLLINLLPVYPFDGGRILQAVLSEWLLVETRTAVYVRIGAVVGCGVLVMGLLIDSPELHGTWIVCLGAVILVLNLQEAAHMRAVDDLEEALLEYELSLDYSDDLEEWNAASPGMLERWRLRREETRVHRQEEHHREVAEQVDKLLEKVHLLGLDALTPEEKCQLKEASQSFRDRVTRSGETTDAP